MENTVSLEVAKELFELGWKKETLLYYGHKLALIHEMRDGQMMTENSYFMSPVELVCLQDNTQMYRTKFSAPQFHEIIELLPKLPYQGTAIDPLAYQDVIFAKTESGYAIRFSQSDIFVSKTNPHDAAAQLLIWCVKNQFVTL